MRDEQLNRLSGIKEVKSIFKNNAIHIFWRNHPKHATRFNCPKFILDHLRFFGMSMDWGAYFSVSVKRYWMWLGSLAMKSMKDN